MLIELRERGHARSLRRAPLSRRSRRDVGGRETAQAVASNEAHGSASRHSDQLSFSRAAWRRTRERRPPAPRCAASPTYVGTVVVSVLLLPSSQRGLAGVISIHRFSQR